MTLRTRKPTGKPPFPLVLIEGPEKCGKTWTALQFSGDERVGRAWALDLGEGSLDEYGAIPGADYEIIDHDGTWKDIVGQLEAAREEARKDRDAGLPPALLTVDSGSTEWEMLKAWVDIRARRSPANAAKLRKDPDAEIKAPRNVWNDVDARHRKFMTLLLTFPGIVVVTARGKEIGATGKDGQPIPGEKDYRVEGHKNLGYDATAWVRLSRTEPPIVVGLRSVAHGVRPGIDPVVPWRDFSLGELVFGLIGCELTGGVVRNVRELDADQVMPEEEPPADEEEQQQAPPVAAERPRAVRGPSQQDINALAAAYTDEWLQVKTKADVTPLWTRMKNDAGVAAGVDVLGLLSQEDREFLGVPDDEPLTLATFATKAGQYVVKFGRAVRAPLDASASAA